MAISPKQVRYIQHKAIVTAIGFWQSGAAERVPTSDMIQLCAFLRAECGPDYLAELVCEVELGSALTVNPFFGLDLGYLDKAWEGYVDGYNAAVSSNIEEHADEWQAKFVGGFDGSNVVDLNAIRLRRGLPAKDGLVVA